MHQKALLFVLLAVGLLCIGLAPACRAQDQNQDEDADVEDDLDLDLAGTEDNDELDGEEETPPAPKAPAAPKVNCRVLLPWLPKFCTLEVSQSDSDGRAVPLCSGDLQGSRTDGGTFLRRVV